MNRVLQYLNRQSGTSIPSGAPTDQELLEKYLNHSEQGAFAELVQRHELSVLKACRQVLRSSVDVDDAFQATFLVLLRRARQIRWQPSYGVGSLPSLIALQCGWLCLNSVVQLH